MKNPKINKKIIEIWNDELSDGHLGPLFYSNFKKQGLAYSGLNPSFSEAAFKKYLKGTEYEKLNPQKFYKWGNVKQKENFVDLCISIDDLSQDNYPLYFKRPKEIAKELGLPVQFLDIFQYRETSQEGFKKRIYDGKDLNTFASKQLDLFWKMLELSNPRIILIANGFGSDLFKEYFEEFLFWNEVKGFHELVLNGKKVPIFFSSMLSGQRSLDRSSYQRLIWHMKQAIK